MARRAAVFFFILAAALFAAAAAGLWPARPWREAVVLRDVSLSARGAAIDAAALAPWRVRLAADSVRVLDFAGAVAPAAIGGDGAIAAAPNSLEAPALDPQHTAIGAALIAAGALPPPAAAGRWQRRVLLFSDGRDNPPPGGAPALAAAARLGRGGMGNRTDGTDATDGTGAADGERALLEIVPVSWAPGTDAQARSLEAPPVVADGEKFPVTAWVSAVGPNGAGAPVTVRLEDASGAVLDERAVAAPPGGAAVRLTAAAAAPGVNLLRARVVMAGDRVPENDVAAAAVLRRAPPAVAWLGAPAAVPGLRAENVPLAELTPARLSRFRVAVLNDLPAEALAPAAAAALAQFARDGGALVVVAGENFAGGGWDASPLAAMLPVEPAPRDSLAVAFALDVSGSMGEATGGRGKAALALAAVQAALAGMAPGDRAAVVPFARAAREGEAVPLLPPAEAARRVAALDLRPGGGTSVYAGARAALARLSGSPAKRKLAVMLTDGDTAESPEERPALTAALRAELRRAGAPLAVVAVGDAPDMALLNAITEGLGYAKEMRGGLAELPAVLSRAVREARGGGRMRRDGAVTARRAGPLTARAQGGRARAYPATGEVRPEAGGELWLATPEGDALLASGNGGAGGFGACWLVAGAPWRDWDLPPAPEGAGGHGGAAFFAALLGRLVAGAPGALWATAAGGRLVIAGGAATATLTPLSDGVGHNYGAGFGPSAGVAAPPGAPLTLPLFPRWPGAFASVSPMPPPGLYRVDCGGESAPLWLADDAECRAFGADVAALRALAAAAGGALVATPAQLASWNAAPVCGAAPRALPLAAFLAAVAALAAGLIALRRA